MDKHLEDTDTAAIMNGENTGVADYFKPDLKNKDSTQSKALPAEVNTAISSIISNEIDKDSATQQMHSDAQNTQFISEKDRQEDDILSDSDPDATVVSNTHSQEKSLQSNAINCNVSEMSLKQISSDFNIEADGANMEELPLQQIASIGKRSDAFSHSVSSIGAMKAVSADPVGNGKIGEANGYIQSMSPPMNTDDGKVDDILSQVTESNTNVDCISAELIKSQNSEDMSSPSNVNVEDLTLEGQISCDNSEIIKGATSNVDNMISTDNKLESLSSQIMSNDENMALKKSDCNLGDMSSNSNANTVMANQPKDSVTTEIIYESEVTDATMEFMSSEPKVADVIPGEVLPILKALNDNNAESSSSKSDCIKMQDISSEPKAQDDNGEIVSSPQTYNSFNEEEIQSDPKPPIDNIDNVTPVQKLNNDNMEETSSDPQIKDVEAQLPAKYADEVNNECMLSEPKVDSIDLEDTSSNTQSSTVKMKEVSSELTITDGKVEDMLSYLKDTEGNLKNSSILPKVSPGKDEIDAAIRYGCSLCNKQYRWRKVLKQHLKTHSSDDKMKDLQSQPNTNDPNEENASTRLKVNQRRDKCEVAAVRYNCSICSKQYRWRKGLKHHLKTHFLEGNLKELSSHLDTADEIVEPVPSQPTASPVKHVPPQPNTSPGNENDETDLQYSCNICHKKYRWSKGLRRHLQTHSSESCYECEICKKRFKIRTYLTSHMKIHTTRLKCTFCDKTFGSKRNLKRHLPVHAVDRMLDLDKQFEEKEKPCEGPQFDKPKEENKLGDNEPAPLLDNEPGPCTRLRKLKAESHKSPDPPKISTLSDDTHKEETYDEDDEFRNTDECVQFLMSTLSQKLKKLKLLNTKAMIILADDTYQGETEEEECDIDMYNTSDTFEVTENCIFSEDHIQEVSCDFCDEKFVVLAEYEKHMEMHKETNEYTSKVIGEPKKRPAKRSNKRKKGRSRKKSSRYGQKRKRSGSKPHKCRLCSRRYANPNSLKRHLLIHTEEKPHVCDECGKRFSIKSYLTAHKKIHSGQTPYECELCSKRFNRRSNLQDHMLVHNGIKQFKCDVCGNKFRLSSHLKRHLSLHTGLKPFECNDCGKEFRLASSLKEHSKLHNSDSLYRCKICGKVFQQRSSFRHHLTNHTKEDKYLCDLCNNSFKQLSKLKKHITLHFAIGLNEPSNCKAVNYGIVKSEIKTEFKTEPVDYDFIDVNPIEQLQAYDFYTQTTNINEMKPNTPKDNSCFKISPTDGTDRHEAEQNDPKDDSTFKVNQAETSNQFDMAKQHSKDNSVSKVQPEQELNRYERVQNKPKRKSVLVKSKPVSHRRKIVQNNPKTESVSNAVPDKLSCQFEKIQNSTQDNSVLKVKPAEEMLRYESTRNFSVGDVLKVNPTDSSYKSDEVQTNPDGYNAQNVYSTQTVPGYGKMQTQSEYYNVVKGNTIELPQRYEKMQTSPENYNIKVCPTESSHIYGKSPLNTAETSHIYGKSPLNTAETSHIYGKSPLNRTETPHIHGKSPLNPTETSHIYQKSPLNPTEASHIYGKSPLYPTETSHIYEKSSVNPSETSHIYGKSSVNPSETPHMYDKRLVNPTETSHIYGKRPINPTETSHIYGKRPVNPGYYNFMKVSPPAAPNMYGKGQSIPQDYRFMHVNPTHTFHRSEPIQNKPENYNISHVNPTGSTYRIEPADRDKNSHIRQWFL